MSVTGAVVYGPARLLPEARRCDRCGQHRPGWSWWATMYPPEGEESLGEACADCHTLPGDTPVLNGD